MPAASFLAPAGGVLQCALSSSSPLRRSAWPPAASNDQAGNTANVDESLTAENTVSNDVTAIDAVTGEDANMAADVNFINEGDLTGERFEQRLVDAQARPSTSSATRPTSAPATTPATDSTTAGTSNDRRVSR